MLTNKLEKKVKLYKTQFDKLSYTVFGGYLLDRLSLELDGLSFRIKYMIKNNKDLDKITDLKNEFSNKALELRSAFGELLYSFLCEIIEIPENCHLEDIHDILAQDVEIDTIYVKFKMIIISDNVEYLKYIDESIDSDKVFNMFPNEYFRFTTDSYNDAIAKAYPELFENKHQDQIGTGADAEVFCHSFTFQTSEACNLQCTYCYQFAKTPMRMEFETAKKFIDNLLDDKYGYINRFNSPAIIIEFIGGEPFLEIDLTRKIYEYFLERCYELDHQWFYLHRVSICSNGLLYFEENVQSFFKDYSQNISFNISIDGNKELHDSCRIQPNGEGSYDICITALNHFNKTYSKERNSKMTLAPSNIKYMFDSIIDFIKNDMKVINVNCVFEEGWNQETAKEEYYQLKKLADYIIDNNLENVYIAIFNERQEDVQDKYSDGNFCFIEGTPILSSDGNKPIENVRLGEQLYTSLGETNICTHMHTEESNDNILIKSKSAFPIMSTHDHQFIVKKHIGKDHYDFIYEEERFMKAEDIKPMDLIKLPLINLPEKNKTWLDEKTAHLLGIYLSRGEIDIQNNLIYFIMEDFVAEFDEKQFLDSNLKIEKEDVTEDMKRKNKKARYHKLLRFYKYTLRMNDSSLNTRFYKLCLSCGTNEKTKHLPELLFNSSKDIIEEFYEAFSSYGGFKCHDPYEEPIHGIVDYDDIMFIMNCSFKSIYLANDILMILRCLGYFPYCEKKGRSEYIVWYIEYYGEIDKNNLKKYQWTEVELVAHDDKLRKVYCPTVFSQIKKLDVHTIIVGGMGAKNCGGGSASMLSMRPNGEFYPCIRYMPTSIGDLPEVCIGDVNSGLVGREQNSDILKSMDENTRRAQNNDICYECPISNDCASCSAYGYTTFGSLKKRTNFICIQMIAEALANVYYWNRLCIAHPEYNLPIRKNNVPDEWAKLVISEDELAELRLLELHAMTLKIQ